MVEKLKLTIIGGGAFRTPRLVYGLVRHAASLHIHQIDFYDPDETRMASLLEISRHVASQMGSSITMNAKGDLSSAVRDAHFIFLTYRVGGEKARAIDERTALRAGLLGQETVGPGGFFMALRSIPVTLDYVQRIRDLNPGAWIVNFTNPAGIVTEAVRSAGDERFVGVCDTPYHLQMEIADYLNLSAEALSIETVGLNHLGWFTDVRHRGESLMPRLMDELPQLLHRIRPLSFFSEAEVRAFGGLPTEYVYFFLHAEEVVERTREHQSRGEILQQSMAEFFPEVTRLVNTGNVDEAWKLYGETITGRSNSYLAHETSSAFPRGLNPESLFASEGYEGVAIRVMEGLLAEETTVAILNVPSGDVFPSLPENAVIECACVIENDCIVPQPLHTYPSDIALSLINQTKRYETATVLAAKTHKVDDAIIALQQHPILLGRNDLAARVIQERLKLDGAPRLNASISPTGIHHFGEKDRGEKS